MKRSDGSIQSSNLPASQFLSKNKVKRDYGIHRCMITQVYFIDDKDNHTFDNKQTTYDGLILGGRKDGQVLTNIKVVSQHGGQFNYAERGFRKSSSKFNGLGKKPFFEQKGDIVYVAFVDGNTSLPIIIGAGVHPLDKTTTGATKAIGPIDQNEFNGVFTKINKTGEYELTRKGGTYNTEGRYFVPADRATEDGLVAPSELWQAQFKMTDNKMLWKDPKSSIEFNKSAMTLTTIVGVDKVTEVINGTSEKITRTFKSGMVITEDGAGDKVTITTTGGVTVLIDGAGDKIELEDSGGGKLKISGGKVALGGPSAELLDLLNQTLTAIQAMVMIGNLGYATSTPVNSATFASIQSNLNAIKGTL